MSYKDNHGIWRHDEPMGDNGEEPVVCPNCGGYLDMDRLDEDDNGDEELEQSWEGHQLGDLDPDDDFGYMAVCSFVCSQAVCEECSLWIPYGPDYYFDIDTLLYDRPKPLTYDEAQRAELEAERQAQEAAGQQRLSE